jgi:hypothetical protein
MKHLKETMEKLFTEICDWYNYKWEYTEKETVIAYYYNENKEKIINEYKDLKSALKEWLPTLIESNKDCTLWSKAEIEFIQTL